MLRPPSDAFPLWPLPLAVAVTFTFAAHLALWLSIRDGHIEACVPVLEGCTSISRAARHGLGNHLFRLLVLPCALLLGLHWWLASRWLGRGYRDVAWLGAIAAAALAVYATFLGTDGDTYRFLRRYGVVCFFGFGYLAQLRFLRGLRAQAHGDGRLVPAMVVVSAMMLLLGVGNVAASALVADESLKDRIENALEWQLGWLLAAWYVLHAAWWRRTGAKLVPA
ncbi:hypothetical protein FZO89_15690 [Luteimonas viscosa]|uniref:Frag1/DRAM/Sfk1 family protein n=1 Tax=Luteimonas viscosa TaxID=1132694 RepID=A0A5D4XLC5_9GAMM|nr:hypothetical protein [Luteimonas viscosa]TYT23672.1 hypothetical protein FZO89_15690 [Luteimonas viscosa]